MHAYSLDNQSSLTPSCVGLLVLIALCPVVAAGMTIVVTVKSSSRCRIETGPDPVLLLITTDRREWMTLGALLSQTEMEATAGRTTLTDQLCHRPGRATRSEKQIRIGKRNIVPTQ